MNQLPIGTSMLAKELLQHDLPSHQCRVILDTVIMPLENTNKMIDAMWLKLSGAQKVIDILGEQDIFKTPLPNIQIYRADIWLREANGNVDFLTDSREIPSELRRRLLEVVDITRGEFSTYFSFHSLGQWYRALIRRVRIPWGLRGTAFTGQAIIFKEEEVPYGANLSNLIEALPGLPKTIGEPSKWNKEWLPHAKIEKTGQGNLIYFNLIRIAPYGSEFYAADWMSGLEKMQLILDTFSMTPLIQRKNFPMNLITHNSKADDSNSSDGLLERYAIKSISELRKTIPAKLSPNILEIHRKLVNRFWSGIFRTITPSLSEVEIIQNIVECFVCWNLWSDWIYKTMQGLILDFWEAFGINIMTQSYKLLLKKVLEEDDIWAVKSFFEFYQWINEINQWYRESVLSPVIQKLCQFKRRDYCRLFIKLSPDSRNFKFPSLLPIILLLKGSSNQIDLSDSDFESILNGLTGAAGLFSRSIPHLSKSQHQLVINYGKENLLHEDIKTALFNNVGVLEKLWLKKVLR